MDKTINCKDCKKDFVLTEKEQQWFQQKSMTEPKRCAPCRKVKREQKEMQSKR